MANGNYVEQGKSFLSRNAQRLALRVVPIAMAAVAVAHASPNFGTATGNASRPGACSGGSAAGTLGSTIANGGLGIILFGNATLQNSSGSSCVQMNWSGSGTGSFDTATLPVFYDFTVTPPAGVTVTGWTLTFNIQENVPTDNAPVGGGSIAAPGVLPQVSTVFSCSTNCSGRITSSSNINVPQGQPFTGYTVNLLVNANWTGGSGTLTVSVPQDSSIHINAPIVTPPVVAGAPALSNLMLMITALGVAGLGATYAHRLRRT